MASQTVERIAIQTLPLSTPTQTVIDPGKALPSRDTFSPPVGDSRAKFLLALFFVSAVFFTAGENYIGGAIEVGVCILMVLRIRGGER